ncbi:hypothetical protein [Edaphobacter dinghuensis]|uniref:hypothetical protein n=1 Tax=Edaphobacter dinghuensis TaxID=1560005 RepID=UPI00166B2F95|nr:hypothetical protein [Edaphobacter dinghuensis]
MAVTGYAQCRQMLAVPLTDESETSARPPASGFVLGDDVDAIARFRVNLEAIGELFVVGKQV